MAALVVPPLVIEPMAPTQQPVKAAPPVGKLDDRLRQLGYEIHARPAKGPVLWVRRGVVYTQEELIAHHIEAGKP